MQHFITVPTDLNEWNLPKKMSKWDLKIMEHDLLICIGQVGEIQYRNLGGGFKDFLFSSLFGEDFHFD